MTGPVRSFDDLTRWLAATQGLTAATWGPDTLIAEALEWDSLAKAEVLDLFDQHGRHLPADLVASLRTIGDLHHYLTSPGTEIPPGDVGAAPRLVPLTAADEAAAFRLFTEGDALVRYRLRAHTPSPEEFHRFLWDRVEAQYLVASGDQVIGLVSAFEADHRNRHAHVAAVSAAGWVGSGAVAWAMTTFVTGLFRDFDFRKLYAEVLASNLERFWSGTGQRFHLEGRLAGHEYVDGRHEDLLVLAAYAEDWSARDARNEAMAPAGMGRAST